MRHQKAGRKFSRTSAHRDAMFSNMAASLFKHELIRTTLPKAKELRRVAEPLITLAQDRRRRQPPPRVLAPARQGSGRQAVHRSSARVTRARPGGYLRILKCGFRAGDNAPMAYVELVDRPEAATRRRVIGRRACDTRNPGLGRGFCFSVAGTGRGRTSASGATLQPRLRA